jgi:hypothetical protein
MPTLPSTIIRAVDYLLLNMDEEKLGALKAMSRDELITLKDSYGAEIRECLGLDGENDVLLSQIEMEDAPTPDMGAMILLDQLWLNLTLRARGPKAPLDPGLVKYKPDFYDFVDKLVNTSHYEGSLEEYLRSLLVVVERHAEKTPTCDPAWAQELAHPVYDLTGFASVRQRLHGQIADLRQMRDAGMYNLDGGTLWMGVDSPAGYRWYNQFPESYLSCAAEGMYRAYEDECTWDDVEMFLTDGQYYE